MNITKTEINERMKKEQPKRVKAVINEFNSGKCGRMGEYIAIIEPHYFKNGNYKQQSFTIVERLETIKKGYGYGNCNHAESIKEIVEIF